MNAISVFFGLFAEYVLITKNQLKSFVKRSPPQNWSEGDKGTILIIPGFLETWVFLETIGNVLSQQGYRILTVPHLRRNM